MGTAANAVKNNESRPLEHKLQRAVLTVKKALWAFLTRGLHDGHSAAPVMRGVISDVHAAGNDRFDFFPPFMAEILRSFFAVNKFFDKLSRPLEPRLQRAADYL